MTEHRPPGHSEDYFGDYRNFWWNADFIALMAARLAWSHASRVLEVGCGAGHWLRTIAPQLAAGTRVTAIDSDPKWSDPDAAWAKALAQRGLEVSIGLGSAEHIPFPDCAFDFVTCQTVLIHLRDPRRAIAEMLRVLAPGGLLLCVEPDNFGTWCAASAPRETRTLDEEAEMFKYDLAKARGRIALGLGDASLGGVLPGLFAASGVSDVEVYVSDKAMPLFPPYTTREQQALLEDTNAWFASGAEFTKDHDRAHYIAGGGDALEFEAHWARELAGRARFLEGVRTHTHHAAGGSLMYLVSGRKI